MQKALDDKQKKFGVRITIEPSTEHYETEGLKQGELPKFMKDMFEKDKETESDVQEPNWMEQLEEQKNGESPEVKDKEPDMEEDMQIMHDLSPKVPAKPTLNSRAKELMLKGKKK